MLPSAGLTAAFLLALVPGWVYLRLRSVRSAVLPRSGLDEILEVVTVGVATTGMATALWALVPVRVSHLADVSLLVADKDSYRLHHVQREVTTALAVFVIACVFAWILFAVAHRGQGGHHYRETVWAGALGHRGEKYRWVGVTLRDGRVIEGELYAFPTGDEHEHREIALQAPIRITAPNAQPQVTPLTRVILNEADIDHIGLILGPPVKEPAAVSFIHRAVGSLGERLVTWGGRLP